MTQGRNDMQFTGKFTEKGSTMDEFRAGKADEPV